MYGEVKRSISLFQHRSCSAYHLQWSFPHPRCPRKRALLHSPSIFPPRAALALTHALSFNPMAATTRMSESGQQHEHRPHAAFLGPLASPSPSVPDSCTSTSSDAPLPMTFDCRRHGTSTRLSPPGSSQQQRCKKCTAESSRRWRRRHPWKTIWLGFVRRAYRKFGKAQLSRFDMRWKGMGVRALAGAITREAGPDGEECTPQALAWADQEASVMGDGEGEGDGEEKCSDTDASSAGAPEESERPSAVSAPSRATGEAAAASASAPTDAGEPTLPAAAAPSAPTGVPEVEGRNWVLTWPADMATLDLQRLVLLGRTDALHRSRNSKRGRKKEEAGD